MDMVVAFRAMRHEIRFANASRRQIDGMTHWFDLTCTADRKAREMNAAPGCLTVTFAGSRTHRTWETSARSILAALAKQAEEAVMRRIDASREAEEHKRAADAARADAAAARQQAQDAARRAAAARAAAAVAVTEAARAAALKEAKAAGAAEQAARERAAAKAKEAEEHQKKACDADAEARDLMQWEIAARDAHGYGEHLLRDERRVAVGVGEGIQAAGGLREVPRVKEYAGLAPRHSQKGARYELRPTA